MEEKEILDLKLGVVAFKVKAALAHVVQSLPQQGPTRQFGILVTLQL